MQEKNSENTIRANWFEIPVSDFDRAKTFYETIFDVKMHVDDFGGFKMGVFPHAQSGGAICWGDHYKPSAEGVVIYISVEPDLNKTADRIEAAGGKIIQAKKQISPNHGYTALFMDSEGNRLALHSMQ